MPSTRSLPPLAAAQFRFYAELNDFLPPARRQCDFAYPFRGTPSVKDAIEAIGVPHTEVDLVLINGESVDFSRRLTGGEHIAVYPVFERFDITHVVRLRPRPLRRTRFVLDTHLGKLARYLRLLGFDTLYRNDYDDHTIVGVSVDEQRVILTRDKGLLKHRAVTHGYWLRETDPQRQLREVLRVFDLQGGVRAFTRCLACNGELHAVPKVSVDDQLPPHVRERQKNFVQCSDCGRVYWPGTHYERLRKFVCEQQRG